MKINIRFLKNTDAVSELVGAVLVLGITVLFLAILQATAVPIWDNYELVVTPASEDLGVYGSKSGYLPFEVSGLGITANRTYDVTLTYYEYDESHDGTGMLTGTVTDESGNPIDSATVMIDGTAVGVLTKPDGRYSILAIPPGTIKVTAVATGHIEQTKSVGIQANQVSSLDFALAKDPTPPPETGWLKGYILDENGDPIEGANVHAGLFLALADIKGLYVFSELDPGEYSLSASANGYVTSASVTVTVIANEDVWHNFTLVEIVEGKGAAKGTVRDEETGDPIASASVIFDGPEKRTVFTDGNGDFSISDLTPGTYTVTVNKDGYETETKTVVVEEGQEALVDISMQEKVITTDDDDDDNTVVYGIGACLIILAIIIIVLLVVVIAKMSGKKKEEEKEERPERKEEKEVPGEKEDKEEEKGPLGGEEEIEDWETGTMDAAPPMAAPPEESFEDLEQQFEDEMPEEDVSFDDDEDDDVDFDDDDDDIDFDDEDDDIDFDDDDDDDIDEFEELDD